MLNYECRKSENLKIRATAEVDRTRTYPGVDAGDTPGRAICQTARTRVVSARRGKR